jgi:hypothetical protein
VADDGTKTVVPDRPVQRGWYLVAFGLLGIALAIAWTGFNQMQEVVSTLQRRVMPGTHEVALAGGRATIYFEHRSEVKDVTYEVPTDFAFGCAVTRPDGKPHPLLPVKGKITYASGEFSGRAVFDLEITAPGAYNLTCDGKQPYVVALGGGIGAWTVVAIVGLLAPGSVGLFVIVFVTIKRRRWFARNPRVAAED